MSDRWAESAACQPRKVRFGVEPALRRLLSELLSGLAPVGTGAGTEAGATTITTTATTTAGNVLPTTGSGAGAGTGHETQSSVVLFKPMFSLRLRRCKLQPMGLGC